MTETESTTVARDDIVAPAAAREFVKKAAEAAKDRATTLHANVEKATTTVEQRGVNTGGEVAKRTRQAQQAAYEDAEAFFAGVDKLASAKSLSEAFQIYVDYMRGRSDAAMARARAVNEYVGKVLADGAKSVQDNVAEVSAFVRTAAGPVSKPDDRLGPAHAGLSFTARQSATKVAADSETQVDWDGVSFEFAAKGA